MTVFRQDGTAAWMARQMPGDDNPDQQYSVVERNLNRVRYVERRYQQRRDP